MSCSFTFVRNRNVTKYILIFYVIITLFWWEPKIYALFLTWLNKKIWVRKVNVKLNFLTRSCNLTKEVGAQWRVCYLWIVLKRFNCSCNLWWGASYVSSYSSSICEDTGEWGMSQHPKSRWYQSRYSLLHSATKIFIMLQNLSNSGTWTMGLGNQPCITEIEINT